MTGCEGYACPPEHSVPASEVIVRTTSDVLATTGGDMTLLAGGLLAAAVVSIGGALRLTRRGRAAR